MPRPETRFHGAERRIVGCECALRRIHLIDVDLVRAQIGHEEEAIVRRENHGMSVRSCLASGIYAGTAMLIEACPFPDASICFDRERGNVSTAIVGDEQRFAGLVDDQMARAASARIDLVEKRKRSGLAIDGVAADQAVFLVICQLRARCSSP